MVTDIVFPFFEILVNMIFGSIGVSLFVVGILMTIILGLCRTSWVFILYWMVFYTMVTLTFYAGGIGMIIVGILSFSYFIYQMSRIFSPQ